MSPPSLAPSEIVTTLDVGGEWTPDSAQPDTHRCFVVDMSAVGSRLVTGYEVVPSEPRIVHPVILVALDVGGEPTASVPGAVAHASVTPPPPPPTSPSEPPPMVEPAPATSLPAPATFDVTLSVTPASARIELDGEVVGTGTWAATLPLDGRAHRLRASADGFEATELAFTDSPPPATLALTRAAVSGRGPRGTGSRDPVTDRAVGAGGPSASGMTPPAVGANGAPILE